MFGICGNLHCEHQPMQYRQAVESSKDSSALRARHIGCYTRAGIPSLTQYMKTTNMPQRSIDNPSMHIPHHSGLLYMHIL